MDPNTVIQLARGALLYAFEDVSTPASLSGGTINLSNDFDPGGLHAGNPARLKGGTKVIMNTGQYTAAKIDGSWVAEKGVTIRGSGDIVTVENHGAIIAQDGTMSLSQITGDGTVAAEAGSTLWMKTDFQTGDLSLAQTANLHMEGYKCLDLKGASSFPSKIPHHGQFG